MTSGSATTRPILSACRIALADLLDPVGVAHVAAEVRAIDTDARTVTTSSGCRRTATTDWCWRRAVRWSNPTVPGLREFGFDVDTYDGAVRAAATTCERLADGPPDAGVRPPRSSWSVPG